LGSNLGSNIIYSGTVAGALEGAMQNIPSIAFSIDSSHPKSFSISRIVIRQIIKLAIKNKITKNYIWNVNIPNCSRDEFKGLKAASQGNQYFNDNFDTRLDPKGNKYYWMVGEMIDEDDTLESDSFVVKNNYASISPISFDLSNYKEIEEVRKILD
jgi:5'-nucleotidase